MMIGPLEYVVTMRNGDMLKAYDPALTPAELQSKCERDDPCWKRDRKPRFRLISAEDAKEWASMYKLPHLNWLRYDA